MCVVDGPDAQKDAYVSKSFCIYRGRVVNIRVKAFIVIKRVGFSPVW